MAKILRNYLVPSISCPRPVHLPLLLSSHSLSSGSEEEDQKTKRFHILSNEDQFKWDLLCELASYANI